MYIRIALLALALAGPSVAIAAEPVGHYKVEGKSPDGGDAYRGTAVVTKTGDTYKVVWTIDGETYVGTAIANNDFIAISYKSGANTGLAMYGEKGND
jgi:hypothetical protein